MTNEELEEIKLTQENIESMIYEIRGQKVMFDFDLARVYGYETKAFNQQVKNNKEKFDEDFMFRITREELDYLIRSQNVTLNGDKSLRCKNYTISEEGSLRSKIFTLDKKDSPRSIFATINKSGNMRGQHFKYLPYAFTEQGIYMLMTVLKGELAVKQSKALIRLFKKMKDYIVETNSLLKCDEVLKLVNKVNRHDDDIKDIKKRLEQVIDNFIDPSTYKQFLILNGEKIEAAETYQHIYSSAKESIFIIDDYISIKTLNLLLSVNSGVNIIIVSDNVSRNPIKQDNVDDFIKESGASLTIKPSNNIFHDRLIVIDYKMPTEKVYFSGASSKDAGNKITTIIMVDNKELYHPLIEQMIFDKE